MILTSKAVSWDNNHLVLKNKQNNYFIKRPHIVFLLINFGVYSSKMSLMLVLHSKNR